MNDVHAEIFIFKILEPPTKKTHTTIQLKISPFSLATICE